MKKTALFALACLLLILIFALPPDERGGAWPVERMLQDLRTQSAIEDKTDGRIIIVDIDERALQTIGRWPWDRRTIARLLSLLSEDYQAASIGVDLLFPEPTPEDAALAALAHHPIVFAQSFGSSPQPPSGRPGRGVTLHGVAPPHAMQAHSLVGIIPALADHARIGHISPIIDPDGKLRHIQPMLIYQGRAYESLALAMMRSFLELPPDYRLQPGQGPFAAAYRLTSAGNAIQLPLHAQGRLRLPYRGTARTFLHVSAADILNGTAPKDLLANRFILVGSSATGLGDLVATPVDPNLPAVQIHAILLQALLDRHVIASPQASPLILATILLLLVLIVETAIPHTTPVKGSALIILLAAIWTVLNQQLWRQGIDLPITPPLLLLAALLAIHTLAALWTARSEKRHLVRQLSAYLPKEVARQVIKGNNPLRPERRELTVMFLDLHGFTTLAEGMDPEDLAQLMDRYLSLVTQIIHRHGGTLDKYMGDGVMAFWGAPLTHPRHAEAAYQAALDIAAGIAQLSQTLMAEGRPPLRVGIGLHTGPATVGNLGTRSRHAYTALGDTVNLASRIEGLTRQLGQTILLSSDTAQQLGNAHLHDLGPHEIRGRRQHVRLYTPAPPTETAAKEGDNAKSVHAHQRKEEKPQPKDREDTTATKQAAGRPHETTRPAMARIRATLGLRRRTHTIVGLTLLLMAGLTLQPATAEPSPDDPAASETETLYQEALTALRVGQYQHAIQLLKRLIARHPNHAGAYLDLALAYHRAGDRQAAEATLNQLLSRFDPPPAIRLIIERQRQALRDSPPAGAEPALSLHQTLGYASNINAGPRERAIEIDLGYGPIQLSLDENSRPQGDRYMETGLRARHDIPLHSLTLSLIGQADIRRYATLSSYDTDFLHAGLLLARPPHPLGWDIALYHSHLRLDNAAYLNAGALGAGLHWQPSPATRLYAQLQGIREDYPGDPIYDARLTRARLGIDWGKTSPWTWNAAIEWEHDQALAERAGGNRHAIGGRLGVASLLSPQGQLQLAAHALIRQDQTPYSPLLFANEHRAIQRHELTALYSHRLSRHLIGSLEFTIRQDRSNIELFSQDNWQAELRLTWQP
ncbi:MAG: CHASE2 domain-containing protein [Pseudomonadota bacterium]